MMTSSRDQRILQTTGPVKSGVIEARDRQIVVKIVNFAISGKSVSKRGNALLKASQGQDGQRTDRRDLSVRLIIGQVI